MEEITWGIIGCGDVAEVKSGPAFQKAENSSLLAVMRRDSKKAKSYAERHKVPLWYDDASLLLDNPEINSIYIATPPSSHLPYALKALKKGKNVYLEKPMALNASEAKEIQRTQEETGSKLSIAHYRRRLPAFLKVKELLEQEALGKTLFADIQILQPKQSKIIAESEKSWRLNPELSGGGYFHDLAPHQLDLMLYYFGTVVKASGSSTTQHPNSPVDDIVLGQLSFKNGTQFRGVWSFNIPEGESKDQCSIYGTNGKIEFSFYGEEVRLFNRKEMKVFQFENPKHIQEPMITAVIEYFRGRAPNPCTAAEGYKVMEIMDCFCN